MLKHINFFIYSNGSCNIYNFRKSVVYSSIFEKDYFKISFLKKISKNFKIKEPPKYFKKYGI